MRKKKCSGIRTQTIGFQDWCCRSVSLCSVIIGLLSIDHLYIIFWPNFLETKFWPSSYPIRGLLKKTKIGNEIIVMGSTFTSNQSFESIFVDLILSLGLKVFPFKKNLKMFQIGSKRFFISRVQMSTPWATITTQTTKLTLKIDIEWLYYDFFLSRPIFHPSPNLIFILLTICFPSTPLINFMLNIVIITYFDDEYGFIFWFFSLSVIRLFYCEFFLWLYYLKEMNVLLTCNLNYFCYNGCFYFGYFDF